MGRSTQYYRPWAHAVAISCLLWRDRANCLEQTALSDQNAADRRKSSSEIAACTASSRETLPSSSLFRTCHQHVQMQSTGHFRVPGKYIVREDAQAIAIRSQAQSSNAIDVSSSHNHQLRSKQYTANCGIRSLCACQQDANRAGILFARSINDK